MESIIQGTISALGYLEDGVYYQEPDCFETIRDLIRFLRNDSRDLTARRICGERNIVENDLIPIMKQDSKNEKMFDITLRLIANLIQPAMVSLAGKAPEDKEQWQLYWELQENLGRAQLAFADVQLFTVLKEKLEEYFLQTEWDDRSEETRLVMERIIVLIRYAFAISSGHRDDKRTSVESNSHDRIITAFLDSGIDQVLIHVASQPKERDFHLSILEIIAYVVKEHNPADLISAVHGRSTEEKTKSEAELRMTVENEMSRAATLKRRVLSSRHSNFAGSYVVKGLNAVNKDNDYVVHKPVKDVSQLSFLDERKTKKRVAQNRRPFEAKQKTHLSSIEVRMEMKEFVERVLSTAFNRMMKSSKELAFSGHRSVGQRNADVHYFLVMRFFLEYCRLAKMSSAVVDQCLGVESFHHVQVQIDDALESAAAQKKEAKMYGMRAQYALSAYKELILIHQHLLDRGTSEEKEMARTSCSHILSVEEYRELGCSIMRKFMPGALSKTFLRDLVLSSHHYFRLLEKSVKSGELKTVKTRRKKRRNGQKKTKSSGRSTNAPERAAEDTLDSDQLDSVWADISEELSDVIVGHLDADNDQTPINSLLDVDDEDHQRFAMLSIQRALRQGRIAAAVGLYRAARDVWLTEGVFGEAGIAAEEEFGELREIFFAELEEVAASLLTAETASHEKFSSRSGGMGEGADEYSDDEDEEGENDDNYETREVSFDFTEFLVKFARTDVLKWYIFLLNDFETNSVELNKALVKMLHRVTFELNMPSRLYQLSLFRIFDRVHDRLSSMGADEKKRSPLYELYTFGFHLLRKYMKHFAELGDKLAPELLFWKGPKECYEIENGYGSYETNREKESHEKMTWTEELEIELRSLYNEYRDMEERPADIDVLDFIEHNLTRSRTRKQIQRKMKEFALDTLGAKVTKGSVQDRTCPIIELKRLVEQFGEKDDTENMDLVDFIRESMSASGHGDFTRQKIIKQLTYLGVSYEKKTKSGGGGKSKWTPELLTELENLKQQYEDMDAEDHALVSLPDYVSRRLSQSRPRAQVEQRLRDIGADIPKKSVSKPRQKKSAGDNFAVDDDEVEEDDGVMDDGEESDIGSLHRESDDDNDDTGGNDELGDLVDSDAEEGDMGERLPVVKKAPTLSVTSPTDEPTTSNNEEVVEKSEAKPIRRKRIIEDSDDDDEEGVQKAISVDPTSSKDASEEPNATVSDSPFKAVPSTISAKKRRRMLDSDDEDDAVPERDTVEAQETRNVSPAGASPVRALKRSRVVLNDSDDDGDT